MVDTAWDQSIKPLLLQRYPTASAAQLREAHAYAYGGCVIQDIGYYPFGSHFVSDLAHYVRSGAFVTALFDQATNMYEYAFAIGALAHYASDISGHPLGVNRSVPEAFPKLRAKFGDRITYEQDPAAHTMVEFSFDVAQIVAANYTPETYHNFVGFKIARAQFERAFQDTYGLDLKRLFLSEDLAFGTFRRGASEVIPQLTRIAWKEKREEILKANPKMTRGAFEYRLSRRDYRREWGRSYRNTRFQHEVWGGEPEKKTAPFASFLVFLARILPKVGPLRTLKLKAPTPRTEAMFIASFRATSQHYRQLLAELGASPPRLPDMNLDTGDTPRPNDYKLADQTYATLVEKLANHRFAGITPGLKADILDFYKDSHASVPAAKNSKSSPKLDAELDLLRSYQPGPGPIDINAN